jgi:hypothetical protein
LVAKHLEALKDGKVPVEFFIRGKDAAQNAKQFADIVEVMKKHGVGSPFG